MITRIGLGALALLIASPLMAQVPPDFCPLQGDFASLAPLLLPVADTSNDGGLSHEEAAAIYPSYPQDLFAIYDANDDGRVTVGEIGQIAFFAPVPDLIDFMGVLDGNNDGLLTPGEVANYTGQEEFARLDRNDNGMLDCGDYPGNEEPRYCPLPQDFLSLVSMLWPIIDTDESGGLSLAEIHVYDEGISQELFDAIDANDDDELSLVELEHLVFIMEVNMSAMPPPPFMNLLAFFDKNDDKVLQREELGERVTDDAFAKLDANSNGVIDCEDFIVVSEGEPCIAPDGQLCEGERPWDGECPPGTNCWPWEGELPCPDPALGCEGELPCGLNGPPCEGEVPWEGEPCFGADGQLCEGELPWEGECPPGAICWPWEGELPCGLNGLPCEGEVPWEGEPCLRPDGQFCEGELPWEGECPPGAICWPWEGELPCGVNGVQCEGEVPVEGECPPWADCYPWEGEPCNSFRCEGELPWEGETPLEGEQPPVEPCHLVPLLMQLFPMLDANGDGGITIDEVDIIATQANYIFPDLQVLFDTLDMDDDQRITHDDVHALMVRCQMTPGDPGGEGGSEGETGEEPGDDGVDPNALLVRRHIRGNGFYAPGRALIVDAAVVPASNAVAATSFTLVETLPEGWSIGEVLESGGASESPVTGEAGAVEFVWTNSPLPVRVAYSIVPGETSGLQAILGYAVYVDGNGSIVTGPVSATAVGHGWGDEQCHSGDFDHDWTFSLSEILRAIQLFNLGGFHCGGETDDGYATGVANSPAECDPHSGDLNTNWRIELGELLRTIQFYNSEGSAYQVAEEEASEDGYLPGRFELK